jgi:hypothetical protein
MKYSQEELIEIIKKHKKWLEKEKDGIKADLYKANLQGAYLDEANLRGANLQGADLQGADLRGANLDKADLRGANLYEADLYKTNLQGADLRGANLDKADLRGANLYEANLQGANLQGADLYEANLRGANLQGADLDFSCLPLRCGGLNWKIDRRIFIQLSYHLCSMQIEDAACVSAQNALIDLSNEFHRQDVPRLEKR